jgi:multiple sugar transport system permease protein
MMIPGQVTLIPNYLVLKHIPLFGYNDISGNGGHGWLDSYWGLIIPGAFSAFSVFLMRQYIKTIPDELLDAARIDGASEFRVFWNIVLPNAIPALLTLGIFTFINNWNDLLWPLVFTTDPSMGTVTSGLTQLTGPSGIIPYGTMMAGSLVAVAPLAVLFMLVQRRFIESVATTGLK